MSTSPIASQCAAKAETREALVTGEGGTVRFQPAFVPAGCRGEIVIEVPWIAAEGLSADNANYLVAPNPQRSRRDGLIRSGEAKLLVTQEPGKFIAFAAAPARLDLGGAKKMPKKQTIIVWSDDTEATFTVRATGSAAQWITVIPETKAKRGTRKFQLQLQTASLPPGKHEGAVEVHATGTSNLPVRIPVTAVISDRK
ncbi:MAG TPA: hypothetical protein VEQ63_10110 [Bryobacteraceae bacterium]|nr:hypothetical protein [Bryobacteraceae bacterium]